MELLLLEDINGVGKRNDIIVVKDGFALNHLLPGRKALVATPTVRKRYAEEIKRRAEEKEHERKLHLEAAVMLAGKVVHFARKATKTGKLYAAITAEQVSAALVEEHSISVPPDKIHIGEIIKTPGNFTVQVKLGGQSFPLQVSVVKEETAAKKPSAGPRSKS
ncbi:50S ribosomal protein L9 [Candidatus Peregrinibacteria bacterium]|nr:50S ribosomal protein L9 [Candidatus Peregrinibacteria bacterium]